MILIIDYQMFVKFYLLNKNKPTKMHHRIGKTHRVITFNSSSPRRAKLTSLYIRHHVFQEDPCNFRIQ